MGRVKESIAWPHAPDRTAQINQHIKDRYFEINPDQMHQPKVNKYNIVGDRVEEAKNLVVYEFTMYDADDPDLSAAHPLWEWENSEVGRWVMKHACEVPIWHRIADPMTISYRYRITAKFMGPALTEWILKYHNGIK